MTMFKKYAYLIRSSSLLSPAVSTSIQELWFPKHLIQEYFTKNISSNRSVNIVETSAWPSSQSCHRHAALAKTRGVPVVRLPFSPRVDLAVWKPPRAWLLKVVPVSVIVAVTFHSYIYLEEVVFSVWHIFEQQIGSLSISEAWLCESADTSTCL